MVIIYDICIWIVIINVRVIEPFYSVNLKIFPLLLFKNLNRVIFAEIPKNLTFSIFSGNFACKVLLTFLTLESKLSTVLPQRLWNQIKIFLFKSPFQVFPLNQKIFPLFKIILKTGGFIISMNIHFLNWIQRWVYGFVAVWLLNFSLPKQMPVEKYNVLFQHFARHKLYILLAIVFYSIISKAFFNTRVDEL